MKTKNIAMLINDTLVKEFGVAGVTGSDVLDRWGRNAFLIEFENDEVKGEIVLSIDTKNEKKKN